MTIASNERSFEFDVAIAGGGPAGLAVAIAARQNGLSAIVFERRASPPDKACGEGVMPPAVRALEELGVRGLIDSDYTYPLDAIRVVQEDGTTADAALPAPGGLGVRRVALTAAMMHRAQQVGAEIRPRSSVLGFKVEGAGVTVDTDCGPVRARFLAAADGLSSRLRTLAGLDLAQVGPPRFGMRQHFRIAPWGRSVEIHLASGLEAYVTPVGAGRVGIAFLWEDHGGARECASIESFVERFPALKRRIDGAAIDSRPRGAGPMARRVRSRVANRFALVGDAAGYVDAITGEGISLALVSALALGKILPAALDRGASREVLLPYERESDRRFRRYEFVTRSVLAFVRRPRLRRTAVAILARNPRLFNAMLKFAFAELR
jgi:flavin-dependent dehydrogenase